MIKLPEAARQRAFHKEIIEVIKNFVPKAKQASNIWAMISVASIAAALFDGHWIPGLLLGAYSLHMSMRLIDLAEEAKGDKND